MKIKIASVDERTSSSGDPYRLVKDEMGNRYSVWDQGLFGHLVVGNELEVQVKSKGNFTNITGIDIVTEKVVPSKETPTKNGNGDVPQEVWNLKDRRMVRMHTQKVAADLMKNAVYIEDKETPIEAKEMTDKLIEIAHILEEDVYR